MKYTNNEAYFDIIEEVDAIIDKSGSVISAEIQGCVSVLKLFPVLSCPPYPPPPQKKNKNHHFMCTISMCVWGVGGAVSLTKVNINTLHFLKLIAELLL